MFYLEELITTYDLGTFPMRVQSLNRTLIDKVFAVCDYYLQGKVHRNDMGSEIAPAAPLDDDISELVRKVCDEDFYKEDYRETTLKLISDSLEYEMLKKHYRELVEKVFE